jgi:hypothetical protein
MLSALVDAALLHTPQAQKFLQLLDTVIYYWPADDGMPAGSAPLLPLLQQLQSCCNTIFDDPSHSHDSSSSSSSSSSSKSREGAHVLVQLQYAFASHLLHRVEDYQELVDSDAASDDEAGLYLLLLLADEMQEACLQLLAGICCCWHKQLTNWQQQQQGGLGSQTSQQLPPLQRTQLHRRVLQLSSRYAAAPVIPRWGPGGHELLHFTAEGGAAYADALQRSRHPGEDGDLLSRSSLCMTSEAQTIGQLLLLAEEESPLEVDHTVLPQMVQLTAEALLLLHCRLQQLQQRKQPGPQLVLVRPQPVQEDRSVLAAKSQMQSLLDVQLPAAARSVAAGRQQQSLPWVGKAVLLGLLLEAQNEASAAAARHAAVVALDPNVWQPPNRTTQRLLERLHAFTPSQGKVSG